MRDLPPENESNDTSTQPELPVVPVARRHRRTRRDVLFFGTGAVGALAGAGFLLPQDTLGASEFDEI